MPEHRIVSLIASATEIVAALGFEQQLVGRSHECDFPPSVRRLPICSEARIDVHASSRQIDEQVKDRLRHALSIYHVQADQLRQLQPTVIITQTQCDVCAVGLQDVAQAVHEIVGAKPQIVALAPNSLSDVWNDIRTVGRALDADERAEQRVTALQRRLADLKEQSVQRQHQATVACLEWLDPLMAAGNWVPELVEIAGGVNLFGQAGRHSPWMTWDALVAANPEVIAIMPCGFDIARSLQEMHVLTQRPAWATLQAVDSNRVYVTDGNHYFNRPGPRLVESAEILSEILHSGPAPSSLRHPGTWLRP